jgi:ribose transport system ATP-binding protein
MPDDGLSDRPLLSLRGVTKRYGGVHALGGVDFSLRAGEIHALLGENGAGKSTLINVLGGLVRPDSGTVEVNGQRVEIRNVTDADRLGIRVIHQELSLAPNLSVAENLFLGREPLRFGLLDRRRMIAEAQRLIALLGLPEIGSPEALVATLSTARQQMVEITRALGVRSQVLILDEPTRRVDVGAREDVYTILRRLHAAGMAMILISSDLPEVMGLSHWLALYRDGRIVREVLASETTAEDVMAELTRS